MEKEIIIEEMKDKWVNLEDIADYLNVTLETVRTWVREGKLPAFKAGRLYKFKLSDVDEWVRTGKIKE